MSQFGADDELDPEMMFRDARAQLDQVAEMQRRLATLRGHAESADGRVTAIYDQNRGLADLQLDPRALRMNAAELQETILAVSYKAKQDLERQVKEITKESFGEQDFTPSDLKDLVEDPQAITQTLGDMGKIFDGATREVEGMLDQVRQAMQGMAAPGGGPPARAPRAGGMPPAPGRTSGGHAPSGTPEWSPGGHVEGAGPVPRATPGKEGEDPDGSRRFR